MLWAIHICCPRYMKVKEKERGHSMGGSSSCVLLTEVEVYNNNQRELVVINISEVSGRGGIQLPLFISTELSPPAHITLSLTEVWKPNAHLAPLMIVFFILLLSTTPPLIISLSGQDRSVSRYQAFAFCSGPFQLLPHLLFMSSFIHSVLFFLPTYFLTDKEKRFSSFEKVRERAEFQ